MLPFILERRERGDYFGGFSSSVSVIAGDVLRHD